MYPAHNPPSFSERPKVPLRVRFYPLWWWYFVACVLVAQSFLVTRLWGGWNAIALLQLVAFQVIFLPRIALIAVGVSLGLTLLTSRLVNWIARPMATRWLAPVSILPPASEIPLYLRTGERPLLQVPGRRKAQNMWEPGWLVLTDDRLLWFSGIWRTVCWEIDAHDPALPVESRVFIGQAARWFGGYVVGMPPRLNLERDEHTKDTAITEVLAIADPAGFIHALALARNPVIDRPQAVSEEPEPESRSQVDLPPVRRTGRSARVNPKPAQSGHPKLPPLRDYSRARFRDAKPGDLKETGPALTVETIAGTVVLPPRREWP